jgi:hypothetical protein
MSFQHRQEPCVLHLTAVSTSCVQLRLSADREFGREDVRDSPDVAGRADRFGQVA